MLEAVKKSIPLTTDYYDDELTALIQAALADLHLMGVTEADQTDPLILQAVKTYVKLNFKRPDNYEQLLRAYEALKGTLMTSTGYTNWGTGT